MNYEVKREGKNQAELTITVEKETVLKSMNQAYLKLVKEVTIPGFRKGKPLVSFWNKKLVKPLSLKRLQKL